MTIYHCYCITNLLNGKKYIGQTTNPNPYNRWKSHLKSSKTINRNSRLIHKQINESGKENFIFELLCCCNSLEDLNFTEEKLIVQYKSHISENGYNVRRGGN